MKLTKLMTIIGAAILLASCETPNVTYFQDLENGVRGEVPSVVDIKIQPEDKLSIVVKSIDQELSNLFNLPVISQRIGNTSSTTSNSSQYMSLYTVDAAGTIDFPVLGQLNVAGLTRDGVAKLVKNELQRRGMCKDPVVTVEFGNLYFSVLGEVARAGRYIFDRDHITLLEALSMAGDLTINGKRDDVLVMRQEADNKTISYRVNLTSASDLVYSPVYYLKQGDVIYVSPNKQRARQSTAAGNTVLTPGFWISATSLLCTVVLLLKNW